MRVGLIGCGYWGSKIRRSLHELDCDTVVYDPAHEETVDSPTRLIELSDAVVVATPPQHHAEMVDRCVERQTPFFCEKPFTLNPIDAAWLRLAARLTDTRGAVGYIALHADGFPEEADKIVVRRESDSAGYHNISAWWDIGAHDVAGYCHLFGRPDHIDISQDFDTYHARLTNRRGVADLQGTRRGGKAWEWLVDGEVWTPYASQKEPLKSELEWWLSGGDNLDLGLAVSETLHRASRKAQHGSTPTIPTGAAR